MVPSGFDIKNRLISYTKKVSQDYKKKGELRYQKELVTPQTPSVVNAPIYVS